jgi:hypothetical protein
MLKIIRAVENSVETLTGQDELDKWRACVAYLAGGVK